MTNIIDETKDKFIIVERIFDGFEKYFYGFSITLGLLFIFGKIIFAPNIIEELTFIILFVVLILPITLLILDSPALRTITFDRTIDQIIIQEDTFIKPLKSLREISFLDIKEFQIEHIIISHSQDIGTFGWSIDIVTKDNKSEHIIFEKSVSYPKELANKIINLTGKNITQIGI